jgi:hypothetical protein
MRPTADDLVEEYLSRLKHELRVLPAPRRRELMAEIAEHIAVGRAELPPADLAEVAALLERIGEPEHIATEARERFGVSDAAAGVRELMAIPLLLIGGFFLPFLGWLAGVALLWASPVWTRRDKLIGTLLLPGGLAPALYVFGWAVLAYGVCDGSGCEDRWTLADALTLAGLAALVVLPLAAASRLAWGLRGRFAHAQR